MLCNGSDLLAVANEHNFAVPAFNISDYAMLRGILEISEVKNAPLIIAIHPNELAHTGVEMLASMVELSHRTSIPVAIHLDHGASYEQVLTSIQSGFTSAMIDGSMLPFADNVALTKRVVHSAHAVGLSVEGELGTIGITDNEAEDGSASIIYTDPGDAVRFISETGVDSLAIAIGTCHGIYPEGVTPRINLDLLVEIKGAVAIPLVLHGGSNNPDAEIAEAVKLGINKINISSDIKVAYHDKMREVLMADSGLREPLSIQPPCVQAMQAVAAAKIDLFDAAGKAALYRR